jgi:anti-sigma regulatory factor (Ser/Thr protein kinase)
MVPTGSDVADSSGDKPPDRIRHRYPGVTSALAAVRADFELWLLHQGVVFEERQIAVLVLSELATNAVQASDGSDYQVAYQRIDGHSIEVSVANWVGRSTIPPRQHWGPDDPLARRGRGLEIVESLADSVATENADDMVRVTVCLRA